MTIITPLCASTYALVLLLAAFATAVIGPNYTCGGVDEYNCDPNDVYGGACCSQYGFCGNTDQYCGDGCQDAYGYCNNDVRTSPIAVIRENCHPLN